MKFRLGAASTLSLTTLTLLVACGGKTISIGGEDTSQSAVPSAVTVASTTCIDGYQHANVCCTGGDSTHQPTCESWPNDPFHPCDSGWTTYPNAAECCSLDNPADCISCSGIAPTTSLGGDTPTTNNDACNGPVGGGTDQFIDGGPGFDAGIPADNCETRCPPGYTGISPYDSKGCCRYNGDGSSECFGEASVSGSSTTTPDEDAGLPPILLPDGGVYDAGVVDASAGDDGGGFGDAGYYDAGGAPPGPVACEFNCPDGWFVADAIEGLCCANAPGGGEECFAAVFPDDNGGGGGSDVPPSTGGSTPTPVVDASAH